LYHAFSFEVIPDKEHFKGGGGVRRRRRRSTVSHSRLVRDKFFYEEKILERE